MNIKVYGVLCLVFLALIYAIAHFCPAVNTEQIKSPQSDQVVEFSLPKEEITDFAAWTISKGYLKPHLKAPSTAEFPREEMKCIRRDEDAYIIIAYVDAQNSFGAMLRQVYTCEMIYKGGEWTKPENWSLTKLTLDGQVL